MTRFRILAASAIACSCLLFALPALAATPAPGDRDHRAAGPAGAELQLVQWRGERDGDRHRDRNWDRDRRRDGDRHRDGDRDRDRRSDRDRDRDRDWHRDRDRDWDRDRSRDRDHHRHGDWRRERDRYHWDYDYRERWRTKRHPRHPYWAGRRLPPQGRYYVVRNYWDYYLPRPPRGHYYVRVDNDVFLVLEATRTIIDAFILLELLGR